MLIIVIRGEFLCKLEDRRAASENSRIDKRCVAKNVVQIKQPYPEMNFLFRFRRQS